MSNTPQRQSPPIPSQTDSVTPDRWISEVTSLLRELEQAAPTARPAAVTEIIDNQLLQVRLGVASGLFTALRCKSATTAAHSLRVALSTSAWAFKAGLPAEDRDLIELAALLHDIGVVGVPEHVLLKPGPLDSEEMAAMDGSRAMSREILASCSTAEEVLRIVDNIGAWYDGSKRGFSLSGEELPLGSRMIAIVEAFDAMTTDRVYRRAMSRERAMSELYTFAGSQFDPRLVRQFAELSECDQTQLRLEVVQRWLHSLDPEVANTYWQLKNLPKQGVNDVESMFLRGLLANMHDAVMFVDTRLRVELWNHGAERLTGITSDSIYQRAWSPTLLDLHDERGNTIDEADCPVRCTIRSGVQSLRRLTIHGRSGRPSAVDAHVIPVAADDGAIQGAILIFHDASSEISLEQRCQNLHEKATLDPLTQVGNRAEFDRVHEMFVTAHLEQHVPCSLIICDIDLFKAVNDTYGHQAGDEAIKTLANLLKSYCRSGDFVARYGGEEFVMLCATCDNATAARRAEEIRVALSQIHQSMMGGRSITASFGVTEVQPGDTPETMLRRSDRALLTAKARGRNMVAQLGTGSDQQEESGRRGFWFRKPAGPDLVLQKDLVTPVPVKMAIEKLRGFVSDHCAKIIKIDGNVIHLQIDDTRRERRRWSDRAVTFLVELRFEEQCTWPDESDQPTPRAATRTKIHVAIAPKRNRDRRRDDVANRAREVLASLRSYLMASEEECNPKEGVLRKAGRLLAPWRNKR